MHSVSWSSRADGVHSSPDQTIADVIQFEGSPWSHTHDQFYQDKRFTLAIKISLAPPHLVILSNHYTVCIYRYSAQSTPLGYIFTRRFIHHFTGLVFNPAGCLGAPLTRKD